MTIKNYKFLNLKLHIYKKMLNINEIVNYKFN